ncbi:MAG: 50S ribosomal protein L4 [Candidatus Omnitrophica bacterium]|nr:50S ribosomal protein L4 [Candidatus Omnitrophota bacterium]MCK4423392.1 50S ribosomal protein L4 [Candidatus Omnitrophota bacterium]
MTDTLPLYNQSGKEIAQVSVKEELISGDINPSLLRQVITAYQSNQRQGNASTKTRGNVRGGGAKPWRQKGTGRARVGSSRNPIWTGGGVAFGPLPKDYRQTVPKKIRNKATVMALKQKIETKALIILDEFKVTEPKTKILVQLLKTIGAEKGKKLLLLDTADENVFRAARNIKDLTLRHVDNSSALDFISADKIVMTKKIFEQIQAKFSKA